jgi:hypothetical protein
VSRFYYWSCAPIIIPQDGLCDFDGEFREMISLGLGRRLFSLLAKIVNSESAHLRETTYQLWSHDTTDRSSGFRSHARV